MTKPLENSYFIHSGNQSIQSPATEMMKSMKSQISWT